MADAKFNTYEALVVGWFFNNTTSVLCSTPGTATGYSLQLHTGDPGEAGQLTTNEADYTGYARMAVERTSSGWTVSGTTAKLTSTITFPVAAAGSNLITHFSIGGSTVAASTGPCYYYGTVTPNITVTAGVTPRLTTNTAVSEL
jgi:hypothetical protein